MSAPSHAAAGGVVTDQGDRDRNALFESVSRDCTGLITRIALSHEADESLRRELIQDILLAVWLALPSFRGQASIKTFVAAIAQKRSISHVISRAREPRQIGISYDLRSTAPLPDAVAVENDMKRQLVESIQRLPIPQREAIVLCLEGFSYADVGEVLGISTNAATLRCQRATAALKAIMDRKR